MIPAIADVLLLLQDTAGRRAQVRKNLSGVDQDEDSVLGAAARSFPQHLGDFADEGL